MRISFDTFCLEEDYPYLNLPNAAYRREQLLILRSRVFLFTVLAVLPLILSAFTTSPATAQGAGETSFVFAASGDLNSPIKGGGYDSLRSLKSLNPDFFLGLGDLSYNANYTGTKWCSDFKNQFSNIEIIPGYHDTGDDAYLNDTSATRSYEKFVGSPGSAYGCPYSLATHPSCEPQGCDYGREYYFDYPANAPIARFIMISPNIYNVTGRCNAWKQGQPRILKFPDCNSPQQRQCSYLFDCWNYEKSDLNDIDYTYSYANFANHWNWTETAIEGAQSQNEWVIVGIHKLCISAGRENCEIGTDLFNLLLSEKVDLILQGDDHAYERSKQLSLNSTLVDGHPLCDGITTNMDSWAVYNSTTSGCIIDNGSRGFYQPGAGTVVVIDGTFSCNFQNPCYNINDTSAYPLNAAESPYFARLMGGNTAGNGNGFLSYTVTGKKGDDGRIDVQTHFAGSFQDFFSISKPPVSTVTWSPPNPSAGYPVAFSAATAGGVPPYSYSWSFDDGSTATGSTPIHSYTSNGYYNVTLITIDSLGNSRTAQQLLVVGSWNPAVSCSPTTSTFEAVLGSVTIQRIPPDSNSTGADYSGGAFKLAGNLPYAANPSDWPFSKRALYPYPGGKPCFTLGVSAFVEVHSVTVLSVDPQADCGIYYDISNGGGRFPNGSSCSTTFNLASSRPACPSCYLHRVYAVIDRDWKAAGIAPPSPGQGQTIDVQGFVYWNTQWVDQPWHSFTGWELHVTAWRISMTPTPVAVSFLSGNGLWYILGALGITLALVSAYGTRFPARIKALVSRFRRDYQPSSEKVR